MKERLQPDAFNLIVRYETGGRAHYEQVYKLGIIWPGGSSGPTGGVGYDFGYEKDTATDWGPFLPDSQVIRLANCFGKTGQKGRQAISGLRDIKITWERALFVFNERNVPREIFATLKAFPKSAERLNAVAFGVLVSVVFNRGTDFDGPRRIEMRAIRSLIDQHPHSTPIKPDKELQRQIAQEIRKMRRLWVDNPESDQDLCDRREDEAQLIENSL